MADTGIFCTQAEMLQKAGSGVNTTLNATTDTTFVYSNSFISQAESRINNFCRYNFSDNYATLNVDVKATLTETASCIAAIYCITYDMGGYSTIDEAANLVNVYRDIILTNLSLLRDKKVQEFINGA